MGDIPLATVGEPLLLHDPEITQNIDVYVDDFLACSLDGTFGGIHTTDRLYRVVLNSFDAMFAHDIDMDANLIREEAISIKKLKLEARAREEAIILGWIINTRDMTIALPKDKASKWQGLIKTMLDAGACSAKEMERMIGRFVRVTIIIPAAKAYIIHLRRIFHQQKVRGTITLDRKARDQLDFWRRMFDVATQGAKLETIVMRMPTIVFFTDAAGAGMGGYCHNTGRGWRYPFPEGILDHTTINHLEFLAELISPLLLRHENNKGHHALMWVDNSAAVSWNTKIPKSDEFAEFLFHAQGDIMLERNFTTWCSHIPGEENVIADILSRRVGLSVKEVVTEIITQSATNSFPMTSQIQVLDLPANIVCWISSILRKVMHGGHWPRELPRASCDRGKGGRHSAKEWNSTHCWAGTFTRTDFRSGSPSWQVPGGGDFADHLTYRLKRITCERSWNTWVRPSSYEA